MAGKTTSVQEEYIHPRSYRDSARLHFQHWIWQNVLGYTLHPSVPKDVQGLKVADIGCGNGAVGDEPAPSQKTQCWVLELAEQVPSSWHLTGFDISSAQFPHKAYLPANVTLQQQDAFEEMPTDLLGSFDVVHIRAVCVVVKNGDPRVLLKNAMMMLKPGGYFQWDDFDPASFAAYTPSPDISKTSSDELIKTWAAYGKKLGLRFEWLSNLPALLTKGGLRVIESRRFAEPKDKIRKATTDNWMMALEETMYVILNRSDEAEKEKRRFQELLGMTVEETKEGVGMWIDWLVVVGTKG
ncbi:MAG: hypothetical protein L6R40_005259 [Gallowayella cf. fulva]|nr:MAG: hypothetical protein L6R40_005259 [Xanthomendoza cf. fulva]